MHEVGEASPFHEGTYEQELVAVFESVGSASTSRVRGQSFFVASSACVIIACASPLIWTGSMLLGIITHSSTVQVGRPLKCCARGTEGRPGICLLGDPNGICCGSEVALLCGTGSKCYLNDWGHPYCCAPRTSGCANVCLDNFTSGKIISDGGSCNPVSPQGFNADGTVLYVDANWDANTMSYQLNGTENITFVDPPIQLGAGSFTMKFTIIPRNEFGVIYQNDASCGQNTFANLFRREEARVGNVFTFSTGFDIRIQQDVRFDVLPSLAVNLYRNAALDTVRRLEETASNLFYSANFPLNISYQIGIPIVFRIVRYGGNLSVFVNNIPIPSSDVDFLGSTDVMLDVDTGVNAPLEISSSKASQGIPARPAICRFDLNASIRDMSITRSADFL